jgi:streptomycin 6-kinase
MECAPFESAAIAAYPTKAAWDTASTEIVVTMLDRWHLTAVRALGGGFASSTFEVVQADGTPAVLKVGFPHTEAIWEAVALEAMGDGLAPRVIKQDQWTWSMLLSEVLPGAPVTDIAVDDALAIGASLMVRMRDCSIPTGLPTVDTEVREFIGSAIARRGREASRLEALRATDLVDAAFELASDLLETPVEYSLVHGDLNPTNIIRCGDGQWLAIDPKPMVGDPAYDAEPLIGQLGEPFATDEPSVELVRRSRIVADLTGLPVARIASWGFVRAALSLCWFIDDELVAGAPHAEADRAVAELRAWAEVLAARSAVSAE